MNNNFRIIDANLNRASEALRTIEEVARFVLNDALLTEKLKQVRHNINEVLKTDYNNLLNARDSVSDVGYDIPNESTRATILDLLKANFKRGQQALRVLEEYVKIDKPPISRVFESARYELYSLEKQMSSKALKYFKFKQLENRNLYLVTDRSQFEDKDKFYNAIALALKGGVDIVQLREKNASTREFIELGRVVKELCSLHDALFIVNDRVDIALALKADGVHLGQDDMDLPTARKLLGCEAIIGNSTHKSEDAIAAMENGADYIGVGPVFTTPTKPGRPAVGYEYVEWASQNVTIPFFAIGGINMDNIDSVISAGARKIAVVRAIINSPKPDEIASNMKLKLSKPLEGSTV